MCIQLCSIFNARIFCHVPTFLQANFRRWERHRQKTAGTTVLQIHQTSSLCIIFSKIEFIKVNLHVYPKTLFNSCANFLHGPTSLQANFWQWDSHRQKSAVTIVSTIPQLSGLCIFIFKIGNHKGNLVDEWICTEQHWEQQLAAEVNASVVPTNYQ